MWFLFYKPTPGYYVQTVLSEYQFDQRYLPFKYTVRRQTVGVTKILTSDLSPCTRLLHELTKTLFSIFGGKFENKQL